jgi:hypothetical protein
MIMAKRTLKTTRTMANIVTTSKDTLRTIFDKVNRVYFFADNKTSGGVVKALGALTGGI